MEQPQFIRRNFSMLKKQFLGLDPRNEEAGRRLIKQYGKYWIHLIDDKEYKRVDLYQGEGSETDLLFQFVFLDLRKGQTRNLTAAGFATHDGKTWITRNRKVGKGTGKLNLDTYKEKEGKFLICELDDRNFFSHMVRLHESRSVTSVHVRDSSKTSHKNNPGFDRGMDKETTRAASQRVRAEHSKIVDALLDAVKNELSGYELFKHNCITTPDVIICKGEAKVIFEVKPDSSPQSIMMAIGQLVTYSDEHQVDLGSCYVVVPKMLKHTEHTEIAMRVAVKNKIKTIFYNRRTKSFDGLLAATLRGV